VLVLLSALALGACAGGDRTTGGDSFPARRTEALFGTAFRHVHERYIDPVAMDQIALAGFDTLKEFAPELAVARQADGILLTSGTTPVARVSIVGVNSPDEWARVTTVLLADAWATSPALRRHDPEQIYTAMFDGIVRRLDDYSRYTDPARARRVRAAREGFGGIGVSVRTVDGVTTVMSVIDDAPASAAGLREHDVITHVDGRPAFGVEQETMIELLRGEIGSHVTLTIERGDGSRRTTLARTLVRAHVTPQSVWYRRDGDFAYIRLATFNSDTATALTHEVARARREIGPALAGIVLDLRDNPGGLLDRAVTVADLFLEDGLIVRTHGRHPSSSNAYAATRDDIAAGLPIAVLINGGSASASEMLAAALQDWGRAVIVGSSSHGKGSVQNLARLPNGGELVVTWSRMYAPSGYVLDRLGVLPGVCTSRPANAAGSDADRPFAAWQRYDAPDPVVARTLRLACPPRTGRPEADVEIAHGLLADPALYRQALRPWTENMAGGREAMPIGGAAR